MNKLIGLFLGLAVGFFLYSNYHAKIKEEQALKSEVEKLKEQNDALAKRDHLESQINHDDEAVRDRRIHDLQAKLDAETQKLQAFQARKDMITAALNDPAKASTVGEARDEIREKNEAIQSLQLQLTGNQDDEKMVDHGGEQAKQYQNVSKAQAMADLNARIRATQDAIAQNQAAYQGQRNLGTADGNATARQIQQAIKQQKADLNALQSARDQVNVQAAQQTSQIHEQVGYEKTAIHASEQEIRAQILALKADIKTLESQASGATRSDGQLKQQATYLDQQIALEKTEIERIKALLKTF